MSGLTRKICVPKAAANSSRLKYASPPRSGPRLGFTRVRTTAPVPGSMAKIAPLMLLA